MKLVLPGLILLFIATFSGSAEAFGTLSVLLTIDDSDPSGVVVTATGLASEQNDSSTNEYDGVDLLQFFPSPVLSDPVGPSSTLEPDGGTLAYNSWDTDNASGSYVDLNLYASYEDVSYDTQTFSIGAPAFTGSWVISGLESFELPSAGATGDIIAGYSDNEGQTIGLWEVVPVPEPSDYGFLATFALAGMVASRRLFAARQALATV